MNIITFISSNFFVDKREYNTRQLVASIDQGNSDKALEIIQKGNFNAYYRAFSMLYYATMNNKPRIVQALIESRVNVNDPGEKALRPLHIAAHRGFTQLVEKLIHAKADVNLQDNCFGYVPLIRAAIEDHHDVVKILLEANADVYHRDSLNQTALTKAIFLYYSEGSSIQKEINTSNLDTIKRLVFAGADTTVIPRNEISDEINEAIAEGLRQREELRDYLYYEKSLSNISGIIVSFLYKDIRV